MLSDDGIVVAGQASVASAEKRTRGSALANRFERRLGVELSQFRMEMARELAAVRVDISTTRLSTIRWVTGLLIAHAGVIIGAAFALMTFLANVLKAN